MLKYGRVPRETSAAILGGDPQSVHFSTDLQAAPRRGGWEEVDTKPTPACRRRKRESERHPEDAKAQCGDCEHREPFL